MLKNNKGFSLIELMVVVAIIAILSTIAIPSYQNFQAKARQKEGFGLLGGFFQSAQATNAEHGFFPGDFIASGYQPTGQLGYRISSAQNPTLAARATATPARYHGTYSTTCTATDQPCTCLPTACTVPYNQQWDELAIIGSSVGVQGPVGCAPAVTDQNFTVVASGRIRSNGLVDTYSMNERKVLTMCNDGLRQ